MKEPARTVRLDKLLGNLGYGSRREIQGLARAGRIGLDGAPVAATDTKVALVPALASRLSVDGEPLDPLPGLVLLLNKPCGITCSHKEAGPIVYTLLPPRWRRRDPPISSVGRLDKDTSGLLLLTDDGDLLHRVIAPKAHIPKRYQVELARPLRGDEAEILASGTLMLDGESKPLLPAALNVRSPMQAALTITEGRYHQVRRSFAALGNHVLALHRDQVGDLSLPDDLEPGCHRCLQPAEIESIFAAPPTHSPVFRRSD